MRGECANGCPCIQEGISTDRGTSFQISMLSGHSADGHQEEERYPFPSSRSWEGEGADFDADISHLAKFEEAALISGELGLHHADLPFRAASIHNPSRDHTSNLARDPTTAALADSGPHTSLYQALQWRGEAV